MATNATTLMQAEKYFLGSDSGASVRQGAALVRSRQSCVTKGVSHPSQPSPWHPSDPKSERCSLLEVSSDGEEGSGSEEVRRRQKRLISGSVWLRRHARKNGKYASHDSLLSRARGSSFHGSGGTLGPLFEEHTLLGVRDGQLATSEVNLNRSLRRYNSSLACLYSGSSVESSHVPLTIPTMSTTRLYSSSPQLTGKRNGSKNSSSSDGGRLPDIKSMSFPQDINLSGSLSASKSKLPSISDTNMTATSGSLEVPSERQRKRRRRTKHAGKPFGSETTGTASSGTLATATSISGSVTITIASDGEEYENDDFVSEEDPYHQMDGTPTETTVSAYVPPVDSPGSQRLQAEREAEEEVKHNWLLAEENKSRMKRFESRCNRLTIHVSDDDAVDAIEDRLEELRMMSKPRKDERSVLERLSAEQRERILRMDEIPVASLRKGRRKGWKPIQKLRWASSVVLLMARGVQTKRLYINQKSDMGQMRRRLDGGEEEAADESCIPDKPSLGVDLLLALTTQPHLRTPKTVTRILWLLRATKAFKNLFPAEMETELAKVVGYERYDDGRIITKQGRAPDRFYYIISGKIGLFRQYQLSTGQVTKGMGFLAKGMTTDPEMMEKQICREDSLVAKGQVEVLIIDKDAFSYLQHTTVGPPIEFIKALDLFEEFPVERFTHNHDAIEYTYYGTGKVIVQDSNRTPWLHIVKSGAVKVIRSQLVIDARVSNESKFVTPRIEALGCGKPFSHANAMLGVQAKQKKLKSTAKIQLPQLRREEPLVSNPFCLTLGVDSPTSYDDSHSSQAHQHLSKASKKSSKARDDDWDESERKNTDDNEKGKDQEKEQMEKDTEEGKSKEGAESAAHGLDTQSQIDGRTSPPGEPPAGEQQDEEQEGLLPPEGDTGTSSAAQLEKRRRKEAALPIINIPTRDVNDNEAEILDTPSNRKRNKEQAHRRAHLQLGLLCPGDVFGLDHMQPALASEAQGVSLLSDGAEVIRISKRFFLQNAGNNTMLKVETMCNEYISEGDAQQVLFDKETWSQYKHALWERMTAGLEVSSR